MNRYPSIKSLSKISDSNLEGTFVDMVETDDSLPITVPKNKPINSPFLDFLENHQNVFSLLRQLLDL